MTVPVADVAQAQSEQAATVGRFGEGGGRAARKSQSSATKTCNGKRDAYAKRDQGGNANLRSGRDFGVLATATILLSE